MKVVISQPMFFPWVGMFEQVKLADAFIYYDDVQFSKGSFTNRVQIKVPGGKTKWMSVPLAGLRLGEDIRDVRIDPAGDWKRQHVEVLKQSYRGAPFVADMIAIVDAVYAAPHTDIGSLGEHSMEACKAYFGIRPEVSPVRSSSLGIGGAGWERVLEVVKRFGGTTYVTGHGAANYLDHPAFEAAGVDVQYMEYEKRPYAQLHGEFTPFVSILDLIANVGRAGVDVIASGTISWKDRKHE